MSVAEKRKLAASLGGATGADVGRSAAMESRLRSLSRRSGTAGAAAQILGVEGFTKDQLAHMNLGTEAGAKGLLAAAGISDGDLVKQVQEGAKKGPGGLAEALKHVLDDPQFKDAQKKKQLDNAEERDPLQAAIKKNGEMANELLKKIAVGVGASAEELRNLGNGDPESTGRRPKHTY